jgi:hypothetical protein
VRLHPAARRRPEVGAKVDREVRGLVPVALHGERHHGYRCGGGITLRRGRGLRGELGVRQALRDPADPIDLRAHRPGGRALTARQHHGKVVPLGALEAGQVLVDHLRLRARHLEPAAGEVLGLLRGERQRGEQHKQPRGEHKPATALEERRKSVHPCLHPYRSFPDPPARV